MPRRTPGTDNRVLLVCRLLNRRRARYLIAGGVAANLHGSVRATRDVDILTVAWTVTFDRADRSKVVRRIGGIRVPYLGLVDLLRSKQTGRPADQADIEALGGRRRTRRKVAKSRVPARGKVRARRR